MAFNGSGVFQRLYDWTTDAAGGVKIRADRMDAEDDGFATGLSNAICKDGQTTITENIPFNNKRITGLGNQAAATDAMNRQSSDARYLGAAAITDVASATTTDIGAAATPHVNITGTTTITSFGTTANVVRLVKFAGALTLTHHATSLILPGGANITTAAGDTAMVASDNSGNWRCYSYARAATAPFAGAAPDVIIEDQKTSGTNGGTATSGARETRTLNTLVYNAGSLASLASNDFTLPSDGEIGIELRTQGRRGRTPGAQFGIQPREYRTDRR